MQVDVAKTGVTLFSLLLTEKQSRYKAHTTRYREEAKLNCFGLDRPWLDDAVAGLVWC